MDTHKTASGSQSQSKIGRKWTKYKSDIVEAYDIGYATGWDASYDVPDRFLAKIAASYGFKKGLRDRRRSDSYIKRYKKKGKNYK